MPVELVKTPLKVCRIVGEEISSIVVEEDINVPDINQDIYKILYPSARVVIKNSETSLDKIVIDGRVLMDVLYSADAEGRPLNSLNISADFTHSLEMAGVKPRMREWIDVVVQHVDCHIINSRKINIKVIMDIVCMVEEIYEIEVPVDVRGSQEVQVLKEEMKVKEIVGTKKDKYNLREEIEIEYEKPPVGEIIKTDLKVSIKDNQAMEGKVQADGNLVYNIIYKIDEDNTLRCLKGEIPFSELIEIPESDLGMDAITFAKIRDCFIETSEDIENEERNIIINASMDMEGKVFKENKYEVLSDLYSPKKKIDIEKNSYTMDEFLNRNTNSLVIKESLNIKHGEPEIEEICYFDSYPIIDEIKVMDDKVGMEGIIEVSALYKSSFSGEPMASINQQFPFKIIVDMLGANTEMYPNVKCWVDSTTYSSVKANVIDFRVVIVGRVDLYKKISKNIICGAEEKEGIILDYNTLPTATMYIVRANDTLWKIAKRYNTTVDALARINNIENVDEIQVGQKLLILKNMRFIG